VSRRAPRPTRFPYTTLFRSGQLRAVAQPVLHALEVELDALLATSGNRVVETDALDVAAVAGAAAVGDDDVVEGTLLGAAAGQSEDRKSTRLNSSHVKISYAV